jgi:hypothetical protein
METAMDLETVGPAARMTCWPKPLSSERWQGRTRARGEMLISAWADFLSGLAWQFFVTLTFDERRFKSPPSWELASREAFWWLGLLAKVARRSIGWVYAVERSSGGAWHVHALVIGTREPFSGGARTCWRERNGIVTVEPVSDRRGVTLYVSKQAALQGELVLADTIQRFRNRTTAHRFVDLFGR